MNEEQEQLAAQSSRLAALIEADQLEEQRLKEQYTILTEQQRNLQQFLADKQQAAQLAQERLKKSCLRHVPNNRCAVCSMILRNARSYAVR